MILTCPNEINTIKQYNSIKIFLAGGITNCPDWQSKIAPIINNVDSDNLLIINPRREYFDIKNKNIQEEQIIWEYKHLQLSNIIVFWFCKETLNTITLYELGKWGNSTDTPICIGIEPGYEKGLDVLMQTMLARKDVSISYNLDDFTSNILKLIHDIKNK